MDALSPMQIRFLVFSVDRPLYVFNGINRKAPASGAVARTVADSLRRRALINDDGMITALGKMRLNALEAA